jgi:manganese transport protein
MSDRAAAFDPRAGWRLDPAAVGQPSLPGMNRTIAVSLRGSWLQRLLAFAGPGYMVSVGYMDPGNWATDIAGGAQFGYTLLGVILLSNLMAILLQSLAVRLGIASDMDLAQACRAGYSQPVNLMLWAACQMAIIACDLAEVIGTAIALNLLFGLPLVWGALVTALDAFLVLHLMQRGFRYLEAFVASLLLIIFGCFAVQIVLAAPPVSAIVGGFVPSPEIVTNPDMLYLAIGIMGATVMPHNLYLHSSIVQTRAYDRSIEGRRNALQWATTDSTVALMLALFVNAAILILAATVFHANGHTDVQEIEQAHEMLSPLLGVGIASTLFAVALLASGFNSTVTATLAGQIVMEGFLRLRMSAWAQRLLTRGLAIVPVVIVTLIYGSKGTASLLVLSQVILSLQLPFAVIPLVRFVTDRRKMGPFVVRGWLRLVSWTVASLIVVLNATLLFQTFMG